MDPFSHFLLGYLLGYGVWGPGSLQYVVAAAIAGGLPDADVALYPLSYRFPLLRHRGISHSIVGVTILAGLGTLVVPWALALAFGAGFAHGVPWAYFVSLEIGGLSHVLLDAMDHWTVPIFAPFSPREYGFDADRLANFGAMSFTVGAYAAMLYERGRTPLWVWEGTAWLLLAAVALFFTIRLLARWRVEAPRKNGRYRSVVPQLNPLRFLLYAEEVESPGTLRIRYTEHDLLRGRSATEAQVEAWTDERSDRPILSAADAVAASYLPSRKKSWFLSETDRFAQVRATPAGFEVFWYSLELSFWGRSSGVLAQVQVGTGVQSVRTAWRNPGQFSAQAVTAKKD